MFVRLGGGRIHRTTVAAKLESRTSSVAEAFLELPTADSRPWFLRTMLLVVVYSISRCSR